MNRVRVALVGSGGRMGGEILEVLLETECLRAVCGVSREKVQSLKTVPTVDKLVAKEIDLVIDFSSADIFSDVVIWCMTNKKPLVSGTTGISRAQKTKLAQAAQKTPVLWAPNMSLGVAVVAQMFQALKHLDGFDFQIEEFHHSRKKDKPSGTALFLQDRLKKELGRTDLPEPLAVRGGGIFGIHRIFAMSDEEMITIEHTALNRRVFARGAVRAAEWLANQKAGLYVMTDVVK